MPNILDQLIFTILPYFSMALFFIETIRRYNSQTYSYTTLSTQFLESKKHFWGMMSFHYGLIGTLVGHVIAFLIPKQVLWWNSFPARLYILETTAFVFGSMALLGVALIVYRRVSEPRLKIVTSPMDWVIYLFLLFILGSGVGVAMFYGWGTSWFSATVSPYLWSLIQFNPQVEYVAHLPHLFKAHFASVFLLIAVFPFTKLVHVLVVPNHYLFRKKQIVRWRWGRVATKSSH